MEDTRGEKDSGQTVLLYPQCIISAGRIFSKYADLIETMENS